VIDFSKDARGILFWWSTLVHDVSLADFEKLGRAKKVGTTERFLGGLGFWPEPDWAYAPEDVVRRADALSRVAATRGAYRISGSNCEHIANWCKYGAHESRQVRYVHAGHAILSFGLLVALSRAPARWRPAIKYVALASAALTAYMQYEAWSTPRRWRPIIAEAETILRESDPPN
jgi:hypothetical protein